MTNAPSLSVEELIERARYLAENGSANGKERGFYRDVIPVLEAALSTPSPAIDDLANSVRERLAVTGLSAREAGPIVGVGFSTLARVARGFPASPKTARKLRAWIAKGRKSAASLRSPVNEGEREAIIAAARPILLRSFGITNPEYRNKTLADLADAILRLRALGVSLLEDEGEGLGASADGSPFVWKWIERALFDKHIGQRASLQTLAHHPNAPWNLGRWDVDHKPYAAEFYKQFPKSAPKP